MVHMKRMAGLEIPVEAHENEAWNATANAEMMVSERAQRRRAVPGRL